MEEEGQEVMIQLTLFDTVYTRKMSKAEALPWIQKYHYSKGLSNIPMIYGTYVNNILQGLVSFSCPSSEAVRQGIFGPHLKDHVMELSRLCLNPDSVFPASKIVKGCIQAYRQERKDRGFPEVKAVVSYADPLEGHHGGVYQAMSWIYTGRTPVRFRYIYYDGTGRRRNPRQDGVNILPSMASERGWTAVKQKTWKHRYIKLLGSKTQKRVLRTQLKLDTYPYPKGSPEG